MNDNLSHYGNAYANVVALLHENGPMRVPDICEALSIEYEVARISARRGVERGALNRPERGVYGPIEGANPTSHAHGVCAHTMADPFADAKPADPETIRAIRARKDAS